MTPFDHCPVCGGDLVHKEVEKLLRGGANMAILKVPADVCTRCGERLYSLEVIRRFETVRSQLENNETSEFESIGQAFAVR